MRNQLFTYSYRSQSRVKKPRGVLRRAKQMLAKAKKFTVTISPSNWFHYSHEHWDWDGIGGTGSLIHGLTLEAHTHIFRAYAEALRDFPKPFQLFLSVELNPTGQDAVYLHSPNPNSEFPALFQDVSWGIPELESLLSQWLREFDLVVGKRGWNYVVYAKNVGLPLKSSS